MIHVHLFEEEKNQDVMASCNEMHTKKEIGKEGRGMEVESDNDLQWACT